MIFKKGQRVKIKSDHHSFPTVTGTVIEWPEVVETETVGIFSMSQTKKGMVRSFWIRFDQETDDGSGDGPYSEASIDENSLELLEE